MHCRSLLFFIAIRRGNPHPQTVTIHRTRYWPAYRSVRPPAPPPAISQRSISALCSSTSSSFACQPTPYLPSATPHPSLNAAVASSTPKHDPFVLAGVCLLRCPVAEQGIFLHMRRLLLADLPCSGPPVTLGDAQPAESIYAPFPARKLGESVPAALPMTMDVCMPECAHLTTIPPAPLTPPISPCSPSPQQRLHAARSKLPPSPRASALHRRLLLRIRRSILHCASPLPPLPAFLRSLPALLCPRPPRRHARAQAGRRSRGRCWGRGGGRGGCSFNSLLPKLLVVH